MARSCKEIAQTLVECIKNSVCVKSGGEVRQCLQASMGENEQGIPLGGECQEFRTAYFNCKRSGLDMRTRIKGPKVY